MSQSPAALWPLALGGLILAGLWLGPLPEMSRSIFSAHMVLHLGVVVVAAPLIGIGLKRVNLGQWSTRNFIFWAIFASACEMLVVWSWHAPALHVAASHNTFVFAVQQLSFLAAGVLIWLVSFSGQSKEGAGIGALAMLMTFMHMTMLGVLLTLVSDLLYPPDLYSGTTFSERLDDQRAGGILMAIGGSFPYLIGGLVLAHRLVSD